MFPICPPLLKNIKKKPCPLKNACDWGGRNCEANNGWCVGKKLNGAPYGRGICGCSSPDEEEDWTFKKIFQNFF